MRIVIPGGSGQVGHVLARHFHGRGDSVVVTSRQPRTERWPSAVWDGETPGSLARVLDGADVVINLSGRSVNCRYYAANRGEIMDSRVKSTIGVGRAIAECATPPSVWLNASTATIYRHSLDCEMDEVSGELGGSERDAPSTWRFSIEVAKAWEDAFFTSNTPHSRKVALRSAMTMSPDAGGIFATLSSLVRAGFGGPANGGRQYVSWIHERDFVAAVEHVIAREDFTGPVNVAAPGPLPYRDFIGALRNAWKVPVGIPATRWMLEIGAFLLRTETELVLKSRRVVPGRLLESGFRFQFPKWRGGRRSGFRTIPVKSDPPTLYARWGAGSRPLALP